MTSRQPINESAFSYYTALRAVRSHLQTHLDSPLSLAKAAEIAGLERTYFSRFFRRKTGISFHEWQNQVRIQYAVVLMKESDLPITRVAYKAGFSSLRTFERVFARVMDMAPLRYKISKRADLSRF